MSNKALFIWIAIGLALIFGLIYSLKVVYEHKEENKRLRAGDLLIRQENGRLVAENLELRRRT